MADEREFTEQWPALADRLKRYLARRKIPSSLQEDIVQETGLRMFLYWRHVDSRRPLWGLTRKVAGLVLWDSYNNQERSVPVAGVPDVTALDDVEQAALARVELERVRLALRELTEAQREALLVEIGERDTLLRSMDALKMLRMRARRRLNDVLGRSQGIVFQNRGRLQKLFRRVLQARAKLGAEETLVFGAASGLLAIVMTFSGSAQSFPTAAQSGAANTTSLAAAGGATLPDVLSMDGRAQAEDLLRDELQDAARIMNDKRKSARGFYLAPLDLAKGLYREASLVARAPVEEMVPAVQKSIPAIQRRIERGGRSIGSETIKAIKKIARKQKAAVSLLTQRPDRERHRTKRQR
ncbi:MAG TPA: hypothetical protein VM784_05285 [Actinomycetota bacterium]|nr:hypothetical protein [Actinomycetota bacterium]